jgi:predicted enzyme related to lactoylglutathione lyase
MKLAVIPRVRRVLETALYVQDLDKAIQFYGAEVSVRPL